MKIYELTQKLIEFESLSYQELPLMRFIAALLDEHGIPYVFDQFNPGTFLGSSQTYQDTANIYVDVGQGREALLLYAHTDVVRAKRELFKPRMEDGWLIGRGAADMKASLAGLLLTVINEYAQIQTSGRRVLFSFVADEETSGTGARQNVRWLQEQDIDFSRLWCVLTEPSDDFAEVEIGGKGYIFFDLEGDLQTMVALFQAILDSRYKMLAKYDPQDERFGKSFITLTTLKSDPDPPPEPQKVVRGRAAHASRPYEGENALEKMLMTLEKPATYIRTGDNSPNTIPDYCVAQQGASGNRSCRATIDVRTNPEADRNDHLLNELLKLFANYPTVRYRIRDRGKAYLVESEQLLNLCLSSASPPPKPTIAVGGSDAGYYAQLTPHVIGGFGPGTRDVMHTDQEKVHLATLSQVPDVFRTLVGSFLSL